MNMGITDANYQAKPETEGGAVLKARKHLEQVLGDIQRVTDLLEGQLTLVMHESPPTEDPTSASMNVRPVSGVGLADQLDVLVAIAQNIALRLDLVSKRLDI